MRSTTVLAAALVAAFLLDACASSVMPKNIDVQVHDCQLTVTRSN
jgi:hypothetical protein